MLLENKKILIMGIRNKWSIAYGIAKSAYENGAKLIFTYMDESNKEKIEELTKEFEGSKLYVLDGASEDEKVKTVFEKIKQENGKIDGIVHAIAHANTEDLHNDFIYTSKEGFSHANDVSAYSFVLVARMAKQLDMLNENASLLTLTYYGSTKVLEGYNVMGVAKAALEASVRYLAENLGKEGIRVNALSSGPIKTLSAKGIKDFNSILTVVEERAPLHKNVTTEQVGNVATFLLSNMSDSITGQVIYADNGYNIMGI
ncbi:MAG: enoyl-ACP reductase [Clostridia bacterium]